MAKNLKSFNRIRTKIYKKRSYLQSLLKFRQFAVVKVGRVFLFRGYYCSLLEYWLCDKIKIKITKNRNANRGGKQLYCQSNKKQHELLVYK